jgi:hypothetical protein
MTFYGKFCVAICLTLLGGFSAQQLAAEPKQEWQFRVTLDDKDIGYHHFSVKQEGEYQQLESEADFEYKLLFIKLYEYQHNNRELWKDDCLARIESVTNANGKPFSVSGQLEGENFNVNGSKGAASLPACVMTFAYWNPQFLQQAKLLNSQNGDFLSVEVSEAEIDSLTVRGRELPAWRYRLQAGELDMLLWYSEHDQWLALETVARGGRKLRYELM